MEKVSQKKYVRRLLIAFIAVLIVLPFITLNVRKHFRGDIDVGWYIAPLLEGTVRIVPTPANTQGAYGFRAAVSPDGTKVAVAGNVTGYAHYLEPALFANGVAPPNWQEPLKVFLKNIHWAGIDAAQNPGFQQIDKNLKIRSVVAMAFSNRSPQRLAYISREFAGELPQGFEQQNPYDVSNHVMQMVGETYAITSEYTEHKNKPPLFFYKLYVTPLEGGEPQVIGIVRPMQDERVEFHAPGHLHVYMNTFSLCWTNNDSGFYYKDGEGISFVSLDGEEERIYSLEKDRMFFSQLRAERDGSVSFIERNNIDTAEPSPEGGADELTTINRMGKVFPKRKLAEGHQWYYFLEGVPQAALGRTKWAFAVPEMQDKKTTVPGNSIVFVGSFKEHVLQQYRVSFKHKMPYYCIMVGFNADESQLFFTKKFNLYDDGGVLANYRSSLGDYRPDAPFSELVVLNID